MDLDKAYLGSFDTFWGISGYFTHSLMILCFKLMIFPERSKTFRKKLQFFRNYLLKMYKGLKTSELEISMGSFDCDNLLEVSGFFA